MSTWKQFTTALDSSTQKFLENKRFTRQRKQFTWDWHAWNVLLASTPAVVLWGCLHRLEKQMLEDEKIREEIQERTGVSSRGYLMPSKKLREEATDMLRHKHERPAWSRESGGGRGTETSLPLEIAGTSAKANESQKSSDNHSTAGMVHSHVLHRRSLEGRLSAIEQKLGLDSGNATLADLLGSSNRDEFMDASSDNEAAVKSQDLETGGKRDWLSLSTVRRAAETATDLGRAAATWITEIGMPEGQRLYRAARAWLETQDARAFRPARDDEETEGTSVPSEKGNMASPEREANDER